MFSKSKTIAFTGTFSERAEGLAQALKEADAVIIGAGAGLSTSAGFAYSGDRFHRYFSDFEEKYGFHDMYSGGFYPFPTLEEHWAYWSRFIFLNRYCDPPKPVYPALLKLVQDKDYFVLTTNVDHCFQKAGFDRRRLFYTQGDYGLWQCSQPCHQKTYDNREAVVRMLASQGFAVSGGSLALPEGRELRMRISPELVPHCPRCGKPMTMNLRADQTFVQDAGWYEAAQRYETFLRRHRGGKALFLELGVGYNTPVIIKYPFWKMAEENPQAVYACVNRGEAMAPRELAGRSLCWNGDIGQALEEVDRALRASSL